MKTAHIRIKDGRKGFIVTTIGANGEPTGPSQGLDTPANVAKNIASRLASFSPLGTPQMKPKDALKFLKGRIIYTGKKEPMQKLLRDVQAL
jgi:hypothetical protein